MMRSSRESRPAEIVSWSNAIASLGLGAGAFVLTHAWPVALAAAVIAFVLLRAALTNRLTVWIAAVSGTVAVSGVGGGLAWLFAHVIESAPAAPVVGGILGAIAAGILPAWAYRRLAQRRRSAVRQRDSLIDPDLEGARSSR